MISEAQRQALIEAACACRHLAYAPYSHYRVGAALLDEEGQIITGVNVENASYSLTICAERAAVFQLIASGGRRLLAMAICTENGGSPCGACRQVLSEFAGDIPIYMVDGAGQVRQTTLDALLPDQFGPEQLA